MIKKEKEMKLTQADREALVRMPKGWFKPYDLGYWIHRPEYRCRRLHEAGYLERKQIGSILSFDFKYRKTDKAKSQKE